jgi:hypothetical protein
MTSLTNYLGRLFLILVFIGVFSMMSASAQPGGHLVVLRTANFGWNLGFNLEIDGRPVASLVQGHQYHTWLPAGEHVLTVRKLPRTGISGPTSTIVNVQPGLTYVYAATWDSDFVFLRPSGLCLTPGSLWQDGWPARPNCAWSVN